MTTLHCSNQEINQNSDNRTDSVSSGILSLHLRERDQTQDCLQIWQTLEAQFEDVPLMCSSVWTSTWIEQYGDLVPYSFVVASRDQIPCGICLLTEGVEQFDGPLPIKTLHLGTAGEPAADSVCVEYNSLLIQPADQSAFMKALLELLSDHPTWDSLNFDGFDSIELENWDLSFPEISVRKIESRYFDLQLIRDEEREVISGFGYSTRKNLRKNMKTYGNLTTEWAETIEQAESIFSDLVTLHQTRWQKEGQPGSYASERFTRFHEALIQKLIPTGQMGLFRVKIDDAVIGCVQVLIDRNRVLCYQGGSAEYQGKLSPGVITDYLCIEECFQRGFDAYDFLAGNSHHKQKMSTHHSYLTWAQIQRPRWKFTALNALRKIKQTMNLIRKSDQ
ncbi:GNAT family N-acetyltransferase [Gimesia maris]|uniref:GNAT family N-acetyltransferase n=1 Tax=Gimesia maris TaxID=122 RepID=UPI0030DBCEC6|tara:strand:- start:23516 stop:24688 length:1173 start_codon:yes stop_codon:yes gene_type:complete